MSSPTSLLLRKLTAAALLAAVPALTVTAQPASPDVIRLGSNENAFGFSPKAKAAVIEAVESANYYNRNASQELLDLLATKEGVPRDHIFVSAGSSAILELVGLSYVEPGTNVASISPGYPQIPRAFQRRGGSVNYAPTSNMGYDFDTLFKAIDDKTRVVFICNPNNPTGTLADPSALRSFIMKVPENVLVFVDEAYLELADTPIAINSMAPLVKLRKNLIVSRTFSKAYGMAGMRIGYAIASPAVLDRMSMVNPGVGPSYLAAVAAKEAVLDQAFMEQNRKNYSEVRQYVLKEFDRMGFKYAKPQGAFILFEIGIDSGEAREKFLKSGIMVTRPTSFDLAPGDDQVYKNWLRVSIGTKSDMDQFLNVLKGITERR